MKEIFDAVNQVFDFVVPIADFLWGFPTNFDWYASIPILGNLSFAIVILIGSGIFFSIKTGFIQVTHFRKGLRILIDRKTAAVGITPMIFPGPTRMAELRKNAARGVIPTAAVFRYAGKTIRR